MKASVNSFLLLLFVCMASIMDAQVSVMDLPCPPIPDCGEQYVPSSVVAKQSDQAPVVYLDWAPVALRKQ